MSAIRQTVQHACPKRQPRPWKTGKQNRQEDQTTKRKEQRAATPAWQKQGPRKLVYGALWWNKKNKKEQMEALCSVRDFLSWKLLTTDAHSVSHVAVHRAMIWQFMRRSPPGTRLPSSIKPLTQHTGSRRGAPSPFCGRRGKEPPRRVAIPANRFNRLGDLTDRSSVPSTLGAVLFLR